MFEDVATQCTDPFELEAVHNGRNMTEFGSAVMFRLRALHAPIVDDERRVVDFKKIKIQTCWFYPDSPITRMTVYELSRTVFGLEWLLLSDAYSMDRDEAWFAEFRDAMELARSRAFYLIQHESNRAVLEDDRYVEKVGSEISAPPEYDYDSDEEKRVTKRPKLDKDMEAWLDSPHRVNDAFVYDMDTSFRAMDEAMFMRWALGKTVPIPRPDLRDLRHRVFQEFKDVKEQTAVNFHREWVQKQLVAPSYVKTHVRWNPHDKTPTSRSVLVKKDDSLAKISEVASILDIVTPPPRTAGRRGAVDIRANTDAALFYVSASMPNDDFVRRVHLGTLDWRKKYDKGIGRLPAEQKWVAFVGDGTPWIADSFAAAFVFYRERVDTGMGSRLNL